MGKIVCIADLSVSLHCVCLNLELCGSSPLHTKRSFRFLSSVQRFGSSPFGPKRCAGMQDSVLDCFTGSYYTHRFAIDRFVWGRKALSLVGMRKEEFDSMAELLEVDQAAEVLLLMVSKCCHRNSAKWENAAKMGIPQRLSCKRLLHLKSRYNDFTKVVGVLPDSSEAEGNATADSALSSPGVDDGEATRIPWSQDFIFLQQIFSSVYVGEALCD